MNYCFSNPQNYELIQELLPISTIIQNENQQKDKIYTILCDNGG